MIKADPKTTVLTKTSTASFQRQVIKPITLSDGTLLKPGTMLFTPSQAISWDPTLYENPEEFDGLRYYNLRQRSAADENKHQFVSTSKNEMHFGGGRHACPGRWFASHEIKLILATLLLNYDMKLKEGEGRPKSILFQWQFVPDQTVKILLKKVEV
jgi:cytochrome P450